MIENWLQLNDVEDFTFRIYTTLRDIYTHIKNQEAPSSIKGTEYGWVKYDENLKAPRFDKLIDKHRSRRIAAAGTKAISINDSFELESKEKTPSPTYKNPHYYHFNHFGESPKVAKNIKQ